MTVQETPVWTVFSATCPSRESLARIANKWTAMIMILLGEEPRRFGALHSRVEGISKKVLTDTLRALERDGLIRHQRPGQGHAFYELTELGETLHAPLQALQVWAEAHVEHVMAAREDYDERRDSALLSSADR